MAREAHGAAPRGALAGDDAALKVYEAQFFGFTPETCMLRIYSAFQECLYDILLLVEEVCVRKVTQADGRGEGALRSRARECSLQLQRFLERRFERLSGRMEALLVERCFSVPQNVLLPEDQPHGKHPASIQEVMRLEASLAELQGSYQAELCARQALLAELDEQREVQQHLDGILRWIAELQAARVKEGLSGLNDSVMCSVKKLQDAVGQICNRPQN